MSRVRGVFRSHESVTDAVRRLSERSVPSDEIEVFVLDAAGNRKRKVQVEDESGALRGAILGGVGGAALGVVIVGLVVTGVLAPNGIDPFGMRSVLGALRTILILAAGGVPLGAILALGHWEARTRIRPAEMNEGSVLVVVETEELAGVAREVLEEAGAEEVVTT